MLDHNREHIKSFVENLETRASITEHYAILVMYNKDYPERTYAIVEKL